MVPTLQEIVTGTLHTVTAYTVLVLFTAKGRVALASDRNNTQDQPDSRPLPWIQNWHPRAVLANHFGPGSFNFGITCF